jgi:hypothetical protein
MAGLGARGLPNVPDDLRAVIKSELELLQRIPEDQVDRRAALQRSIGDHIDDLLVAYEKSREFQRKTRYFTDRGHWRDIVLFVTTVLFAVIIWHADHHRPVWLPLLIATIVMSVLTAVYAVRGFLASLRPAPDGDHKGVEAGGGATP